MQSLQADQSQGYLYLCMLVYLQERFALPVSWVLEEAWEYIREVPSVREDDGQLTMEFVSPVELSYNKSCIVDVQKAMHEYMASDRSNPDKAWLKIRQILTTV